MSFSSPQSRSEEDELALAEVGALVEDDSSDPSSRLRFPRPQAPRGRIILVIATAWLVLIVSVAILADVLPLKNYAIPIGAPFQKPGFRLDQPLGTDNLGRSETSRIIFGARASLLIALVTTLIGLVIGTVIGLAAATFRGVVERVVLVGLDVLLAIPGLVLVLVITTVLEPSFFSVIVALCVFTIPSYSRLARSHALTASQEGYVGAATLMGAKRWRIAFRDLLPNILGPLISFAFIIAAIVIVAEGSLSFLGLGVPPPQPSWGRMIADGRQYLETYPYLVFVPGFVLVATVYSLNVVGDWATRRWLSTRDSVLN